MTKAEVPFYVSAVIPQISVHDFDIKKNYIVTSACLKGILKIKHLSISLRLIMIAVADDA